MKSTWKWLLAAGGGIGFLLLMLFGRVWFYPATPVPAVVQPVRSGAGQPIGQEEITLFYHERKPYYTSRDGSVRGLCADPVNMIFKETGIPHRWQQLPAKRQLEIIKRDMAPVCAVGWYKTPNRELFAKFTLGIYQDRPTLALARSDNDRIRNGMTVTQVMGDRGQRLLKKESYSYGSFIDQKIDELAPRTVITSADNLGMFKMIFSHRADYFFLAEEEAHELIEKSGLGRENFKTVRFADMPAGSERHLLCSQSVDDAIIARLNAAIRTHLPSAN